MAQPPSQRNGHHGRPDPSTEHQLAEPMAGHEMTEPETPARALVILPAQDITLSEILTQLEAGKVVLILPPSNDLC